MASSSSPSSPKNVLRYVKLSEKAQAPARAFVSTGLTLYSAVNVTIPPHGRAFISTDLRVAVPLVRTAGLFQSPFSLFVKSQRVQRVPLQTKMITVQSA